MVNTNQAVITVTCLGFFYPFRALGRTFTMAVPNRHDEIFKKSQLFIDFTFILIKKLTIF